MELRYSEEQEQLRALVRRFCGERSPEAAVRAHMSSERGWDASVWRALANELGVTGLLVPEELGGAGMGPVELAVVMEETGRALLCAPFFSSAVLATRALLESGDALAQKELLPAIASGERIATLAWAEARAGWDPARVELRARRSGNGWLLEGSKSPVTDGETAELVLVAARGDSGVSLFAVEGQAKGLTRTPIPPLDLTRRLARLEFASTPARLIGPEGQALAGLERTLDHAAAALAAESLGGAQFCLDLAVEYAKTRLQFGRPIGSYQAIKHRCADTLCEVETARSAAMYAGFAALDSPDELRIAASMAKAHCSEVFFQAAARCLQIHGGIGFTWENPTHLYLKRAKSSSLLLGDPVHHRDRLARALGA
jgi:alkylation response protein AidB-like acyl-CoA dehydrogenase